ncbi:MAG: hypothetical protein IJ331_00200 [Ruminococcus sp.]|nr:hypothetical protein [Ruminococcus sp.]
MSKILNFYPTTGLGGKQTYKIGNATYIVFSKFMPLNSQSNFKDKFEKLLTNEFAHLMDDEDIDTIKTENVCSTVGKEDKNAVEENSA